ncbi:MAG: HAMP domain-containing histidine kinase [Candidatus Krumholzibacteriota bacterium]|nr:HAMP domain-containing histidine kinase [Candidatus Krumholzibacteriota bacterium]
MKLKANRKTPGNLPFLLKAYFIVGTVILVSCALWYNNSLIRRMKVQSENTTRLFSRFTGIALEEVNDETRRTFIREMRSAISIPFIMTDIAGRPMIWDGIGIEPVDDYDRLRDFNPNPTADSLRVDDPLLWEVLQRVLEFDKINKPIKVESKNLELYIHYGATRLTRELALAPYIQLAVFIGFTLLGFYGFRAMKIGEQRSIWVGMAKETAHQLGTPLSSIMGWIEIIKAELEESKCTEKVADAIREASADVDRLSQISSRFSKIGSAPRLEYHKLAPIIEETVEYFERRRPALKLNSTITVEVEELPLIRCSRDLLGWVFENLIKNSLDAIADQEGKITIQGAMNRNENRVEITFSDNGKGMSSSLKNRVFSPGITTKARGWGLGLALVRRIVEEIHHGSIRILYSQPGKGTRFRIEFPVV